MNQVTKSIALPVSVQDLLGMRKSMRERTLNDHVDDIHVALWSNDDYHRALEAVYDEDAIEGSLAADNFIAAGMIRDYAKRDGKPYVASRKLATIVKSLNIVLRRYGISRKDRAVTIGGETVSPANNGE